MCVHPSVSKGDAAPKMHLGIMGALHLYLSLLLVRGVLSGQVELCGAEMDKEQGAAGSDRHSTFHMNIKLLVV